MTGDSGVLAQEITRKGSKQTYFTTKLLVDGDLREDCYRAYAYFRWVDDYIDVVAKSRDDRIKFIERQSEIVAQMYNSASPEGLTPQEAIIRDLILHHRDPNSGLRTFIDNFLAILLFDARRKGRTISQDELDWYTERLGMSVTECIQYFIHNGHHYPKDESQYHAASAAHVTHMLRDFSDDLSNGFINVPTEYLEQNDLQPSEITITALREWVKGRVELARWKFRAGKKYIDSLQVLRCKIAGHWYCARFERILDVIEADDYFLRRKYDKGNQILAWFTLAKLTLRVTLRHFISQVS